jgi:hypothetical protein
MLNPSARNWTFTLSVGLKLLLHIEIAAVRHAAGHLQLGHL